MVEQDCPEVTFEGGRDKPPHILIAAEAMSEHHIPVADTPNMQVIAFDYSRPPGDFPLGEVCRSRSQRTVRSSAL
jgi:hypothetical protein